MTGPAVTGTVVTGPGGLRPPPEVPPEILAAIAAAVEQAWPRPAPPVPPPTVDAPNAWRFSGRWWHRPIPTRRGRPYPSR